MMTFFLGIGFGYNPDDYFTFHEIGDRKTLYLDYKSKLSERDLRMNFSTFREILYFNIKEILIKHNIDTRLLISFDDGLGFEFNIGGLNDYYDQETNEPVLADNVVFF